MKFASTVKSHDKDVVTVLNGLHPSARPVECLEQPYVDFVVRGEPEYTTLELIQALEQESKDFKKIQRNRL